MKRLFLIVLSLFIFSGCEISSDNLTYNQVVESKDKYVGKSIVWQGSVATELSQISGIKFWIIDKDHNDNKAWFWAYDKDTSYLPTEAEGKWVSYLLKKYIGSDEHDENTKFEVKGIVKELDCEVADFCVPNIEFIKIKKIK